ncbi:MAG: tetratricopeptide repeat protein [Ekhidna sp.]|nr:tetratricopeptide repeat protein [Ekhidna sp.]
MGLRKGLVFGVTILLASSLLAQVNKRQAQLITLVGDDYYELEQYRNALYYYQGAFKENPEYVKAQFQMAQCYRKLEQYDSAKHHYQLIIENDQDFRYPLARYELAYLLIDEQENAEAIKHLKAFRSLLEEHEQNDLKRFSKYYEQAKTELKNLGAFE